MAAIEGRIAARLPAARAAGRRSGEEDGGPGRIRTCDMTVMSGPF